MNVYLVKKEKNRVYKSEAMVSAIFGRNLFHNKDGAPYLSGESASCGDNLNSCGQGLSSCLENGDFVSISDTKNYWACAIYSEPIGIDIEEKSRIYKETVVRRLHKKEREYLSALSFGSAEWKEEFLCIWTKKESYSKLCGKGLSLGFTSFCVVSGEEENVDSGLYSLVERDFVLSATQPIAIKRLDYDAPFLKTATEAGADILDMFGCSAATLKDKLLKRGYSEDECDGAVFKLIELGFLNDSEYARSLARKYEAHGYSAKRIEFELIKKGVGKETAREFLDEYKEGDKDRAYKMGVAALGSKDIKDDKIKAKVARKLSSLGYETHLIYDIIDRLK